MNIERRPYLTATGGAALALLAGCLDESDADDDDPENESDENGDETESQSGPEAAVESFLEAAANQDTDAITEVAHSASFLNPEAHEESEFEYRFGSGDEVDSVDDLESFETAVQTADASIDDVLDLEDAAFVSDRETLEDDLGGEEIALVRSESTYRDPERNGALVTTTTVWIVATDTDVEPASDDGDDSESNGDDDEANDDGTEWHVYWSVLREETIDDLEAAFEAPIVDEDDDVVAEIDWEHDQARSGNAADGEDLEWDVEWAKVVLTDSPGRDAETVRIESTIEGSEFELFGEGSNAWARSWVAVSLNPDGDQIVVTAIDDGEETVVHRERYEP